MQLYVALTCEDVCDVEDVVHMDRFVYALCVCILVSHPYCRTVEQTVYNDQNQINIAVGKKASQSSSLGLPGSAVDGDLSTNFSLGTCSHTAFYDVAIPWWSVDLGEVYNITEIRLTNRGDCCGSHLQNFFVFLGNKSDADTTLCVYYGGTVPDGATVSMSCTKTTVSRFIKIQLNSNQVLSLCEVQVFVDSRKALKNFDILLGNFDNYKRSLCMHYTGSVNSGATVSVVCNHISEARYVTIQLDSNEMLSLCEVQVFGEKIAVKLPDINMRRQIISGSSPLDKNIVIANDASNDTTMVYNETSTNTVIANDVFNDTTMVYNETSKNTVIANDSFNGTTMVYNETSTNTVIANDAFNDTTMVYNETSTNTVIANDAFNGTTMVSNETSKNTVIANDAFNGTTMVFNETSKNTVIANDAFNGTTMVSNETSTCLCPCSRWNDSQTSALDLQKIDDFIKTILLVRRNETSKFRRKRSSAADERISAKRIGYMGIFIFFMIVSLIVLSDLVSCIHSFHFRIHNVS